MSEINITKDQYNRLPYKTTKIAKGKTYGDIIGLLETHGIHDYQWTRYEGTDQLAFPLIIERKGIEQRFLVKLTVPKLMYPKQVGRGRNQPTTITYLEKISWRIFWWHLKSKLEAIEFGISDEVKEFMYNIHYQLEDGREISLGETLLDHADQLANLHALEDKRTEIKADYKVVNLEEK